MVVRTSRGVVLSPFLSIVLSTVPLSGGRVLCGNVISSRSHAFIAIAVPFDKLSPLEMVSTRVLEGEVN